MNTGTALLLLLIAPLFLAASPPPIDGSFCSNVKETLQLNGTFAKPKRFRVFEDAPILLLFFPANSISDWDWDSQSTLLSQTEPEFAGSVRQKIW